MTPARKHYTVGSRCSAGRQGRGFTLIELLVVVAIVAVAAVLVVPALAKAQGKIRSSRCLRNLQDIGTALNLYSLDSNDKLPYAALRYNSPTKENHLSWDDLLAPYLGLDLDPVQRSQDGTREGGSLNLLECPLDKLSAVTDEGMPTSTHRRSYSMPEHNMGSLTISGREATAADWPPCPVNQTGIGLRLDGRQNHVSEKWNPDDEPGAKAPPRYQAAFQTAMFMEPTNVIFMTERFDGVNRAGAWRGATIADISKHIAKGAETELPPRVNYLMLDGHVENLIPLNTYSATNRTLTAPPSGMWTILADD